MTWLILSIISVFALATAELTQQYLLNRENPFNPRTSSVLTFLFQSLLALPVIFILGISDKLLSIFEPEIFSRILLVTFISSIAMIFYLKSFRVKNISISSIFISFSVVVATFLGIIFFSESVSYLKFLGILLILIAIFVANYKNVNLEKNHIFGLMAGLIFGVCYTLDKSIIIQIHPVVYIFWAFLMVAIWGFLLGSKSVIKSLSGRKANSYFPIMVSGVGYFAYNFMTFSAYRFGGEVGRVDAINNSQIFLIILFEFFILKHTQETVRKIFSAALSVIGIVILGLAK